MHTHLADYSLALEPGGRAGRDSGKLVVSLQGAGHSFYYSDLVYSCETNVAMVEKHKSTL